MYRVRYNRKVWRTKWPLRKWFPPKADPRFCKKCGLPHQDGPPPERQREFCFGHVGGYAYPSGSWKRDELAFEFGRYRPFQGNIKLLHLIPEGDLDDLAEVVAQARAYRDKKGKKKPQRR